MLVEKIHSGEYNDPHIAQLIFKLKKQLDKTTGKKVYGYLKPEIKNTVDDIFKYISRHKDIAELYEKWCELERQKYKTYTQKEKEFPPLYENKVFQPVRNMIIHNVYEMQLPCRAISDTLKNNIAENVMLNDPQPINSAMLKLFSDLSRIIYNDYENRFKSNKIAVDHKLKKMIQQKKQELGMKL